MTTRSNPYSLGWGAQFPSSSGSDSSSNDDIPSVRGALPTPTLPRSSNNNNHIFQFVNIDPTIMNCTVLGLANRPMYNIHTEDSENSRGCTKFTDMENTTIATIEWQELPTVEIRVRVSKMLVSNWIKINTDPINGSSVRVMDYRGLKFVWAPYRESLRLYRLGSAQPCVVVEKVLQVVTVELTREALVFELLEPAIVAVTLLFSGRRLE